MAVTDYSIWQPLGPAPIQDPFRDRLNRLNPWGSGQAAGAIHSLKVVQPNGTGDAWLYGGAVNGGLWGRPYSSATDSWGEWKWLSIGNFGYEGSQSIGAISASVDHRWLAIGQGVFSNFAGLGGEIDAPLRIAERLNDGNLRWLTTDLPAQQALRGQPVRALLWAGPSLVIGTQRGLFTAEVDGQGRLGLVAPVVSLVDVRSIQQGPSGRIYAAIIGQGVFYADPGNLNNWRLVPGTDSLANGADNLRISIANQTEGGKDVIFFGTSANKKISDISRGVWDGQSAQLSWSTANVAGRIGTDQAELINFAFAADPTDNRRVFAGGNNYPKTSIGRGNTGGLVAVSFKATELEILDYMFPNAEGTAPHADSQDVVFLSTSQGSRIIQSDDGGIYQKGIGLNAPWQSLNDGLRTTEGYASDWSNIGNLMIAAMQDNSVAIGNLRTGHTWLNVYSGDGSIGRFDDGIVGSDGLARAYYSSQMYDEGEGLSVSTYGADGTIQSIQYLNLTVIDQFGNPVSFQNYDFDWAGGKDGYPFYQPVETNPYRAGDYVMAGRRNLYEAIHPHWASVAPEELLLLPLLPDTASTEQRLFTAIAVGSNNALKFKTGKPDSWDALYTAFFIEGKGSFLFGRPGGEGTDAWKRPGVYGLRDLTPNGLDKNDLITSLTLNPDNPQEVYATVARTSVDYSISLPNSPETFLRPSKLVYSPNGGESWEILVEVGNGSVPQSLPQNINLQQVQFLPAKGQLGAELYVGGYGGLWKAPVGVDGRPGAFSGTDWAGLPESTQLQLWNTDLRYDPVDDVLIAAMMGQGSWLISRNGSVAPAPIPNPGLRVTSSTVPQDLASYQNRKGRSISGTIAVSLERTEDNRNSTVTVDLELLEPEKWKRHLIIYGEEPIDGRISLSFAPGVNELYLQFSTKHPELILPDITLEAQLTNAQGAPIANGKNVVSMYANGETPGFFEEKNGIFYAPDEVSKSLAVLLPRASLDVGYSLGWYKVDDSNGGIQIPNGTGGTRTLSPNDADYLTEVEKRFQPISKSSLGKDSLAFNAEQAAQAFNNPAVLFQSEYRAIGELGLFDLNDLKINDRFALALRDSNNNLQVSPLGFAVDKVIDHAASFTSAGSSNQVVLAPGKGEFFVADPFLFGNGQPSSNLTLQLDVARMGSYRSDYGLFRVDDITGGFDSNGDGTIDLTPGSISYGREAIRRALSNSVDGITGLPVPDYGASLSHQITLASRNVYATFVTPNRTVQEALAEINASGFITDQISFSIAQANINGTPHQIAMGNGFFAFEDSPISGDMDFNDMLLRFSMSADTTSLGG